MANIRILLSRLSEKRTIRRTRRELIQFTDAVTLFLSCGFDLSHAWSEGVSSIKETARPSLVALLSVEGAGLSDHLKGLTSDFPQSEFRQWFGILETSYRAGTPIVPVVKALAESLRRDQLREFDEHCRSLPTRTNIYLMIFFLPPALALIFAPLLIQMTGG